MRVGMLGLGLVGGSIARALREGPGTWSVTAWTPSGTGTGLAVDAGIIEQRATTAREAVRGADLVVLAAPADACLELLRDLAGSLRAELAAGAVVTDVASTKGGLVALADSLGIRYVGGHPMAGRETAGFRSADAALFRDRPWVVVPGQHADAEAIARVETLADACGAHAVRMSGYEHDALVAGISHMPLVLAAALVEAVAGTDETPRPDWAAARALAAGGWASMTRLAQGDVTMGAGIAATNAAAVAVRLRDLQVVIDEWLTLLEAQGGPDRDGIASRLAAAKRALRADAGHEDG